MVFVSTSASIFYDGHGTGRSDGHTQGQIMAISDSYLKSCLGRERDKVEEKADRDGLWVRISKKGAVTFFYRFRFLGKQDKMTIGSYPEFGLKAARDEVTKWAAILARGENPRIRQNLDKAKINSQYTFEELFREWHSMVCIQKETSGQILRTFEIHVFPKLGKYPAHQLTLHNWLTVLDRLAQGYSEITRRVISNGRQCYSWAVKRQLLEVNPLSEMSGRDFGIQKQMGERTLDRKELAIVWRAIEDSRLIERNKILYKLALVWACRVGELRQAEVSHFDFEEGTWTVPWENHKTGRKSKKPIIRPIIPEMLPLIAVCRFWRLASVNSPGFIKQRSLPVRRLLLRSRWFPFSRGLRWRLPTHFRTTSPRWHPLPPLLQASFQICQLSPGQDLLLVVLPGRAGSTSLPG
jgi:hypothetical protein